MHAAAAALVIPAIEWRTLAQQTPSAETPGRTDALPLKTTGIEHLGISVPDVEKSGRFYGQVFNPALYREQAPPLRYYATLGVGYVAIGALREGPPRVDHFCTLVQDYRPQDVRASMAAAGLPEPGRLGMIGDPDGLQLQLLGVPGGLAKSTVPADRLTTGDALVRPSGLENVVLRVSDVDKAVAHYRALFGDLTVTRSTNPDRSWLPIARTRLGLQKAAAGQAPGVDSFGVRVAPFDSRALADALRKIGATVEPSSDQTGLRFKDPDGIVVELIGRA